MTTTTTRRHTVHHHRPHSGYHGIFWHEGRQEWEAQIYHNGKNHYVGVADTPEELVKRYNSSARKLGAALTKKTLRTPKSRTPGIYWDRTNKAWKVMLIQDGKRYYGGYSHSIDAAQKTLNKLKKTV